MKKHGVSQIATAVLLLGFTPGLAGAACDLGIETLNAPDSINGCPAQITGDDDRRLKQAIRKAFKENNAAGLEDIKAYVRQLHDAYKAGPKGYEPSVVLVPVKAVLEALVGENQQLTLPAEQFTLANADELFDKLIVRAEAGREAGQLTRIGQLEKSAAKLAARLDEETTAGKWMQTQLLAMTAVLVAFVSLLGIWSYLLGRRLNVHKNAAEDWRSQEEQRSQKLGDALAKRWENEIGPLKKSLEDLAARLGGLETKGAAIAEKQAAPAEAPHQADELPATTAPVIPTVGTDFVVRLGDLERSVASLLSWQERSEKGDELSLAGLIKVERGLLLAAWQKFERKNGDLAKLGQEFSRSERKAAQDRLLLDVPRAINLDDELRTSFESAVAPLRDHNQIMAKFALIPGLTNEPAASTSTDEATELLRIRESAHLLSTIQSSSLMSDRLRFRLDKWVSERFVGFADLLFQKFQQAQLSEDRGESLAECLSIARELLEKADLAFVDIILGESVFDSSLHVGRSTGSNPRMKNGVISGVIRNGLVRKSTGQVVRQPEVIVNRV